MEKLLEFREKLVIQYKIEKEQQLKMNENRDYIKERAEENVFLFKAPEIFDFKKNSKTEHHLLSSTQIIPIKTKEITKENADEKQTEYISRKR